MAAIAKRTSPAPSMCSTDVPPSTQTRGDAGEALAAGDSVFLHTDGKYYKANGTALDAANRVRGQVRFDADIGEPCCVTKGCRYEYAGVAQTPGIDVYLSASVPGGLDTAVGVANAVPIGYVVEDGKTVEFFYPR